MASLLSVKNDIRSVVSYRTVSLRSWRLRTMPVWLAISACRVEAHTTIRMIKAWRHRHSSLDAVAPVLPRSYVSDWISKQMTINWIFRQWHVWLVGTVSCWSIFCSYCGIQIATANAERSSKDRSPDIKTFPCVTCTVRSIQNQVALESLCWPSRQKSQQQHI